MLTHIKNAYKSGVYISCVSIILFIWGCASPGTQPEGLPGDSGSVAERDLSLPANASTPNEGVSSAVSSLLQSAEQAYDDKQLERAASLAERAIRIEPTSPGAYFVLAQVRFAQAQYNLSTTLLSKARSLAIDRELLKAIDRFADQVKLNR